ncbi:hypothetical protein [Terasakiella sp. SH-1]|uniref:hypothetical protein n=1 Tax=Terasakiella sp. SH-1 TaxID=2560057 RepID=UPI0010745868|nr:hypothetical protein [Terasakiella sp. SH-1]
MAFSFPSFPVNLDNASWSFGDNSADSDFFYVSYADGTTVFTYDGYVSVSKGNEYHSRSADGSESHRFEDGSSMYMRADGSMSVYNDDGSGFWSNADGSMTLYDGQGGYTSMDSEGNISWSNAEPPLTLASGDSDAMDYLQASQNVDIQAMDQEPPEPEVTDEIVLEDGSVQTTLADGTVQVTQEDGSYTQTMPDGAVKSVDANGDYTFEHADGSTERGDSTGAFTHNQNDGSVRTGDADGNVTVTQENGSYKTEYADGRIEEGDGQGTIRITEEDGSYRQETPDGVVETGDSDGNVSLTQADGSYVTTFTDGSTEAQDVDGNVTTTQTDGSYVTEHVDGYVEQGPGDGSYTREYDGGRVDTVNADGEGYTTYTSIEYSTEGGFHVIEHEIQVDLGASLGEGLGAPTGYLTYGNGENVIITYADGTSYNTAADNVDMGWTEGLPGEVSQISTSSYTGETKITFEEGGDVLSMTTTADGHQFTEYSEDFVPGPDMVLGGDAMPAEFSIEDGMITVQYPDGSGFKAPAETVDTSFLEQFPEGVTSLETHWDGNLIASYEEGSDVSNVTMSPDGAMFVEYQPGVALDEQVGTDMGLPVSYTQDGDTVTITYEDGSGFKTDASNVDLSWKDEFPDPDNLTNLDTSYGNVSLDYAEGSEIDGMEISDTAVVINYDDGSKETQYPSGTTVAVNADGIEMTTYEDGSTSLYNPHTQETHTSDPDGGYRTTSMEDGFEATSMGMSDDGVYRYSDDDSGDWASVQPDGGYFYNIDGAQQSNFNGDIAIAKDDGSFEFQVPTGGFAFGVAEDAGFDGISRLDGSLVDLYQADGTSWNLETNIMDLPEEGIFGASVGDILSAAMTGGDLDDVDLGVEIYPNPSEYGMGEYPEGVGTTVTNEDGSMTLSRPDGYEFTWHTDGHQTANCPNGATQEFYPNATGNEPSYVYNYPDVEGRFPDDASFTKFADGSASFVSGDGRESHYSSYPAEEGDTITWQMQDGSYGVDTYIEHGGHIRVANLPNGEEPHVEIWEHNEYGTTTNVQDIDEAGFSMNEDGSMSITFDEALTTKTGFEFPDSFELPAPPASLEDDIDIPFPEEPSFAWENGLEMPTYLSQNDFFDDEEGNEAPTEWAANDNSDDLGIKQEEDTSQEQDDHDVLAQNEENGDQENMDTDMSDKANVLDDAGNQADNQGATYEEHEDVAHNSTDENQDDDKQYEQESVI